MPPQSKVRPERLTGKVPPQPVKFISIEQPGVLTLWNSLFAADNYHFLPLF